MSKEGVSVYCNDENIKGDCGDRGCSRSNTKEITEKKKSIQAALVCAIRGGMRGIDGGPSNITHP